MIIFEAFEPTWFWGVEKDVKIKEYDLLYKYPSSRLRHQEMQFSSYNTLFFKPLSVIKISTKGRYK